MFFKNKLGVCLIVLLFSVGVVVVGEDAKKKDAGPSAKAYATQDKKPPFATFINDPGLWGNMKMVMKKNKITKISLICVTGTYILYAKPDYHVPKGELMRLLSGNDACVSPGKFFSMQLVQPASGSTKTPSLALFKQLNLLGTADIVRNVSHFKGHDRVQSILIHGDKTYMVVSHLTGKRYCIKPGAKSPDSVCLKMSLKPDKGWKDDNRFSIAMQGPCKNTVADILVDDCRKFGSGKLEQLKGFVQLRKRTEPKGKEEGKANKTTPPPPTKLPPPLTKCEPDNRDFLNVLEMSQTTDLSSPYQMFFPVNKSLAWRSELLDNAFEVMMMVCPEEIVPHKYLQVLREFYIFLAEKLVWSKGGGKKEGKSKETTEEGGGGNETTATNGTNSTGGGGLFPKNETMKYMLLVEETEMCLDALSRGDLAGDFANYPLMALEHRRTHLSFLEYDFRLQPFPKFLSQLMEVVWLVWNSAASVCHIVSDFQSTFYLDFSLFFSEMYLEPEPLKKEWYKPGKYSGFIPFLFGGTNTTGYIEKLAICATTVFHRMETLIPLPRPEGMPMPPK